MTTPDPRLNRWERLREMPPADEAAFHVETADDPIAQADLICAGCNDDWPCAFERGRRAEYALLNEPCGYAGMAPTGRGTTPHEAAEPWTCVGPKGHAPAAHTFARGLATFCPWCGHIRHDRLGHDCYVNVGGASPEKRLLELNRLADVAVAERDCDGTDGYASTVAWTNEVRPEVVLDLIADVLQLRSAIRRADEFLNVTGDPIAAHITLVEAISEPRGGRFGGDWSDRP